MPDKKDSGIFGFGLLGSRKKMERCRQSSNPLRRKLLIDVEIGGGLDEAEIKGKITDVILQISTGPNKVFQQGVDKFYIVKDSILTEDKR